MNEGTGAVFHERSGWVQLCGAVLPFAAVLAVAVAQPRNPGLIAAALVVATLLTIVIQTVAHIVLAVGTAAEPDDAEVHQIESRAELWGGRILTVGAVLACLGIYAQRMVAETAPESLWHDPIIIGHLLLGALVVSEAARLLRAQIGYRHGL